MVLGAGVAGCRPIFAAGVTDAEVAGYHRQREKDGEVRTCGQLASRKLASGKKVVF